MTRGRSLGGGGHADSGQNCDIEDRVTLDDLGPAERLQLVDIARESVRVGLAEGRLMVPDPRTAPVLPVLRHPGASFVTLRRGPALLGCIGSLEPSRPLFEDVAHNAFGAAFADPRLPSVTTEDFAEMSVKISVLGPLSRVDVSCHDDLASSVVPGADGVLVVSGPRRGTFLPSVWQQVPQVDRFLAMLWDKAGLPAASWPANLEVYRYATLEFGD
jgi:AmmeMemoRadiSam system protein A